MINNNLKEIIHTDSLWDVIFFYNGQGSFLEKITNVRFNMRIHLEIIKVVDLVYKKPIL